MGQQALLVCHSPLTSLRLDVSQNQKRIAGDFLSCPVPSQTGWPKSPSNSPVSIPLNAVVTDVHMALPGFSSGCWGSELRSSHVCSWKVGPGRLSRVTMFPWGAY